jgi:transcriptional regulator with XRE-family HTH domain
MKKSPSQDDRPRIGQQLRALRKERKLTIQDMADLTSLSTAFISLAERDLTTPSLVSLARISKALGVEISALMEIPPSESIIKRADEPQIVRLDSPLVYHQLASDIPGRKLDAFLITVPPGFVYPIETRPGEHFRYVLKGELWSKSGDTETVLRPGDSMHFDARTPYGAENRTDEPVVFLFVGTPSFSAA